MESLRASAELIYVKAEGREMPVRILEFLL
jgi:hypothetical protein